MVRILYTLLVGWLAGVGPGKVAKTKKKKIRQSVYVRCDSLCCILLAVDFSINRYEQTMAEHNNVSGFTALTLYLLYVPVLFLLPFPCVSHCEISK